MPIKNENLLILLTTGILAGSASILTRYAGNLNYFTIAFYRLLIATLAVATIGMLSRRIRAPPLGKRLLLISSGIFLGLHFIAFTYAVQFTSVSNATFLGDLGPVFVALQSPLILHERITSREVGFVSLAVVGSLLSGSRGGSGVLLFSLSEADMIAILAAFFAANYTIIGRLLRPKIEWLTYVGYVYLVASIVVAAISIAKFGFGALIIQGGNALALVGLGLIPTFGSHSLYNLSLGRVKAVTANLMLLLEPVIASVLAYFFFKEAPTYLQVFGYSLIMLSILGVGLELSRQSGQDTSK